MEDDAFAPHGGDRTDRVDVGITGASPTRYGRRCSNLGDEATADG